MRRPETPVRAALAVLALCSAGCGLGLFGDESGGADNLPTLGAGPFGKPEIDFDTPADEPYLVADRNAHLRDPAVRERGDGGFSMWFGRHERENPARADIWRAGISVYTELPDREPSLVLAADATWEQGRVTAPSIAALDDGTLVMFYEAGVDEPGIGRADSSDGGDTWTKHPDNPLFPGHDPAAVYFQGAWTMYFTRADAPGIRRAESEDGVTWLSDPDPVVVARPAVADAFDRDGVSRPFVLAQVTEAGQRHWSMFFNGQRDEEASIGFAGSFDGVSWERFAGVDAILAPGGGSEYGPAAIIRGSRAFLFFHEARQLRDRITIAIHP